MRLDTRFLAWGAFLVVFGAVVLSVQQGLLERSQVAQLWRLWPLLLVGLGVGLLLRGTPVGTLGGLLVAGMLGLLAAGILVAGPAVGCTDKVGVRAEPQVQEGQLVEGAQVRVGLSCGDLSLTGGAGGLWRLEARQSGDPPVVQSTAERLTIRDARDGAGRLFAFEPQQRRDWRLVLPPVPAMRLDLEANAARTDLTLAGLDLDALEATLNASEGTIDLTGSRVGELTLDLNAGRATLVLPPDADVTGNVDANASTLSICLPPADQAGVQLTVTGALSNTDFAGSALEREGDRWRSPGYSQAEHHTELAVSANAASVQLRQGGCE
jgi:LiaI-LiaF-like transmembrane region